MSHKNYPKTHCPLTGKICVKHKILKITELYNKDLVSFGMCQDCNNTWAEEFLNVKVTPIVKPELSLGSLPDAIKEIADMVFGPKEHPKLPKITVSHDLTITPKLLQDAARRVAKKKLTQIACPDCGITLEEMSTKDRLGCAKCYETFIKYLEPLLQTFHESLKHKGKIPKNWEQQQIEEIFPADEVVKFKIASLKDEQRDAINEEKYEKAGKIAIEIKELQEQLKKVHLTDEVPLPPPVDEDQ